MGQSSPGREPSPEGPAILQSILHSLSDAIVVADCNGRCLLANAAAEQLFGFSPSQAAVPYGLFCSDTVTPLPAEQWPLARAIGGETVRELELFVRNVRAPEGQWQSASAAPLRDGSGRICGGVLVLRDITARKRAEEELRRQRDWAAAILDTVASLVVVLDRAGRIVSFNRACEQATGYRFEEVRGRQVWDFLLAPEEAERVKEVFASLRAGHFPNQHENDWLARDGRRRLIAWCNTALVDAAGEVQFVLGTGLDITERKRTEDELRQTADTLGAVIQTSPLAIVAMDLDGTVRSWNRAAERMFGWSAEEIIGQAFPIVPAEDEEFFRSNQERLCRGETIAGVERQRRRKDGALIDVALWNAPRRDGAGRVVGAISVIADVSERKRLEEQFRQSQKMEAVGRLAGGVAHDFNNLLTVISGYTQMLLEEIEPGDAKRDYVEEVVHAAESATALTNQLLAFSRRQIVSPRIIDLNTLIGGMDRMLHRLLGEDVELAISLAARLPKVKIDDGQFQQVLMNLVVNARDAMPEGGTIRIESGTATVGINHPDGVAPGAYVTLTVSDTGKGMTEEVRKRAFEPFFTTKGRGKGTGLGLSTVYGIVKQAGGEVTIASEPDNGSTFRIYLPSIEEAVAAGVETPGALGPKTGTETVLVVEDDAGLRKLIRGVLESHGYTVLEAADFRAALEFCEAHAGPIHLLLADVVLPGISGRELASRATALRPKLQVLLTSGYTDHAALEGRLPFLQKPFSPDTLLTRLRQVLEDKGTA